MKFVISDTFTRALEHLDTQSNALIKQQAFDFQMNPAHPGLKFHKLDRARDKNFWSFRVNDDLRIIVHRTPETFVLCYADHHDAAYRWAERRKLSAHPETGAAQMVEIIERTEEIVQRRVREVGPALFERYETGYLMALGVPPEWVESVRHVSEDEFLSALMLHLPEEAVERLMELASGTPVPIPTKLAVEDPFLHPDAQRRFRVLGGEAELRQALEYPWDQWIVFLHPSQRRAVERTLNGPGRVNGSAGTGKTVVGLHRAARLAGAPRARILLTTFSRTLAVRLARQADILMGADTAERQRVEVVHVHKLAFELWSARSGGRFKPVSGHELVEVLESANRAVGQGMFPTGFIKSEWDALIDPFGLSDWEAYRVISRSGRGTPVGARQRLRIWKICERAREVLAERGLMTWSQLCHQAAAMLDLDSRRPFHHVIADESQDFGPAELRLVRQLAAPGQDDVLFCGDMGQRIYRGKFSWKAVGVDVRGRSMQLKVNYRTTEEIRRFADRMLPGVIDEGDGESGERQGVSLLNGPEPTCRGAADPVAETEAVAEHVEQLLEDGFLPGEIAIFARTETVLREQAQAALDMCGVAWRHLSDDAPADEACVSLGTMHRAKGLEFKAVVVMGASASLLPLAAALRDVADPADREAIIEQERQVLYVACTRARERLLVTYTGNPSELLPVVGQSEQQR